VVACLRKYILAFWLMGTFDHIACLVRNEEVRELLEKEFLVEDTASIHSAKGGQRLARTVRRSFDFMRPEKSQRLSQNQDMTVSKTETPTSPVPADRRKF
jgi:hypothetical protein